MENKSTQRSIWRQKLYDVIFGYHTFGGKLFDILLLLTILSSVIIVSLESVKEIDLEYSYVIDTLEWIFTILFTVWL